MSYSSTVGKIANYISEAEGLSTRWVMPPAVDHLPYMATREHYFLSIAISLSADTKPDDAAGICLAVTKMVVAGGYLTDEKGVEVAAYAKAGKRTNRLTRLSVLAPAFPLLASLGIVDLRNLNTPDIKLQFPLEQMT